MKAYNVILLYNAFGDKILMCERRKPPYQGLKNLVGGKVEPGEDSADAAYRELREETSVPRDAVDLLHLMDFTYYHPECRVEVYAGKLKREVTICGDENDLLWADAQDDFFDGTRYAGEGNIGHMVEVYREMRAERNGTS
jgi:8-oxo-dGTP diphosphatase